MKFKNLTTVTSVTSYIYFWFDYYYYQMIYRYEEYTLHYFTVLRPNYITLTSTRHLRDTRHGLPRALSQGSQRTIRYDRRFALKN